MMWCCDTAGKILKLPPIGAMVPRIVRLDLLCPFSSSQPNGSALFENREIGCMLSVGAGQQAPTEPHPPCSQLLPARIQRLCAFHVQGTCLGSSNRERRRRKKRKSSGTHDQVRWRGAESAGRRVVHVEREVAAPRQPIPPEPEAVRGPDGAA